MRCFAIGLALTLSAGANAVGHGSSYPADPVAAALKAAGRNQGEIRRVLSHYANDPRKLDAARWLVEHMIGKAYKVVTIVDRSGKDVGFDCLKYPNLNAAHDAYDALEKRHGPLRQKITAHYDLANLKADFLIEHIDRAFEAWTTLPWARRVSYEAFREYVLPYRGGKEPAEAWRAELMARYASISGAMKDPSSIQEAADLINKDLGAWVGFWDLYYMHPTEQGFSEMKQSRKGRCGDLSNLATMVLRSNGIPCAIDYTPYWADTGNNHAWPVALDQDGAGRASVGKAAKVYRKTFANQPSNLAYHARRGETLPPWLDRPDYADVTNQYLPTSDVRIHIARSKAAHAYLCVFNDGEWRPIHWATVSSDGDAVFTDMGRDILYLPVTYHRSGIKPVGPPFVLTTSGNVVASAAQDALPIRVTVGATSRGTGEYRLKTGAEYELYVWRDGWRAVGKQTAAGKPLTFDSVPSGALYWLVETGSRREERPFVLEDGKPVWR